MYKNQRRRGKRPAAAAAAADRDNLVAAEVENGDKNTKSPINGQSNKNKNHTEPPSKKKSDITNPKKTNKITLESSDDEVPARLTRKSAELRKSHEKSNSKVTKNVAAKVVSEVDTDEDQPQRGKEKTIASKSTENSNSKSLTKQIKTPTQKFIIDTLSSDEEVPNKEKRKSSEKKQSLDNVSPSILKKAPALTQKGKSDNSSSDSDEQQRGKTNLSANKKSIGKNNAKNLENNGRPAKQIFDESSSEDEVPQKGKGKALANKKTNVKSSKKVVAPAEKITIDTSSSDDQTPMKEKGKSLANNKSKSSNKTVPSPQKVPVDDSSTEDEIPLTGKVKSLPPRKAIENNSKTIKRVVTSTQKTSFDSSSEEDAPQTGNKRANRDTNEPPAKRTQRASHDRVPDFPASLAVSSIFSPDNTPEKQMRIQVRSPQKRINPKNRNTGRKSADNPFFDQLSSLGFTFGDGEDEPNCLDRDQASFVRLLDSALRNDKRHPQNVTDFVRCFEAFVEGSVDNLRRTLDPTQSSDDFARKSVQECLLRLLLNVDSLQPRLWPILLAKISELVIDEEEEKDNFELLHRIIRQMRCLDRVIEGTVNICDQLFIIYELATKEDTKRELILLLPDVISEDDQEKAARAMLDGLTSNQALIPAYVDTLATLSLSEETRRTVVEKVIDILSRADTKYFQVIIKFLLTTADNLEPVIRGIRKHLDLDPAAYGNDGNEGIMLAATLKDVENKKALVATWMELVEESETQRWLAVDFVALLVNYSKVKAPVVAAFKKLAHRGADAEKDIQKVYPAIKSILEQDYLDTMRQILDSLFKSRLLLESQHAAFWYRTLLNRIETCHVSQKILDDVLSHIGHSSDNPVEVSLALNSLTDAANEDKDSMARHTQRILTLMHNIELWPLAQVRQVMNLLLSLVYHRDGASGMQDVMTITIRKHLNHPSFTLMSVVRNSKFRHVFGSFVKRDNCYDNIRVSKSSLDSMACAVNPKFLAIIVESGGGAFIVLPLTKYGRVAPDHPVVDGHKGYITDVAFCPHDDCVIASASDDCTVKVWQIPETGLAVTMTVPVVDLVFHQRRVNLIAWHPSANNVLLSAASDNKMALWNVGTGEVLRAFDCHPDVVFSAGWNWDGSRLVTTCKDKRIRIVDPRSGLVLEEAVCHEGSKPTRAIFLKSGQIFTTGFSKMSEWQYSLREPGKLGDPVCLQSNDSTNGIIFPLYDADTNMIYLCGKGDSLIRYFEVTSDPPFVHFISIFTAPDPQRGIGMMPKRGCDVRGCEVAAFYRLNATGHCQVVSMKCPRKSELFQEDLFPDTVGDEPAISADDWVRGVDAEPVLVSLRFGAPPNALLTDHQPNVLNRMRSTSFVDIPRAAERSRREEDEELVPVRNSSYGAQPSLDPTPLVRPRSQTANVLANVPAAVPELRPRVVHATAADSDGAPYAGLPRRSGAVIVDAVYKEKRPPPPAIFVEEAGKYLPASYEATTPPEDSASGWAADRPPDYESSRKLYARLKTLAKCSACEETIFDEEFTEADGRTYHIRHFNCSKCDKPLAGNEYYQQTATDLLFCDACYRSQANAWRSKGIVGMVAQLKHMPPPSALDQLKVVFDVAENFGSEAQGLLYDELASACEELHPDVSDELRNMILQAFEETYVVNLEDADSQGRVCYEIIRSDSPLAIPFAGVRASARSTTMFAQLRLIHRMLAVHDALEDVSALLACAVVLPDVDVTDFVVARPQRRKEVVDSFFACVNFFRELVNGFSRDRDSKAIVVQRLEQIIEMNKTLSKFLAITYDYVPPQCQFFVAAKPPPTKRPKPKGKGKGAKGKKGKNQDDDMDVTKGKAGRRGKKRKASCGDDDDDNDDEDNSDDDFVSKKEVVADLALYRDYFRELDMNVFVILNCPLRCPDDHADVVSITGETMKFLLTDYLSKLESMFAVRSASPFRKPSVAATAVETTRSAKYCIKLSALLRHQLDSVLGRVRKLLKECGGIHDSHEMFVEGTAEIKECGTLLLRCLHVLLAWPGFQHAHNAALKEDVLARLNKRKASASGSGSARNDVGEAFDGLVAMADDIVLLPGAIALLKLLAQINAFDPTSLRTKTMNQLSKAYLQRSWFDVAGDDERGGRRFNDGVDALLTFYVDTLPTEHRIRHVADLVALVEKEQEEMGRGETMPSFRTINKQNFHVLYKVLCLATGNVIKLVKRFSDWSRIATALASLTAIIQHMKNWKNMKHFARLGNDFLTALLKKGKGAELLDKNPTEAFDLLKTIQITTRFVHRIITDAKSKKDVSLSSLFPSMRRNQDKLIMRVKAMCALCPEAFSSGNLRNKNLAGEEIFTQEMADFDTSPLEADDSDIDDDVAENNGNEDDEEDATESDISTTI